VNQIDSLYAPRLVQKLSQTAFADRLRKEVEEMSGSGCLPFLIALPTVFIVSLVAGIVLL